MGRNIKIQLEIPISLGSNLSSRRLQKSIEKAALGVYKQEDTRLRIEINQHGKNIYNAIVQHYYASYTPKIYDRHSLWGQMNPKLRDEITFGSAVKVRNKDIAHGTKANVDEFPMTSHSVNGGWNLFNAERSRIIHNKYLFYPDDHRLAPYTEIESFKRDKTRKPGQGHVERESKHVTREGVLDFIFNKGKRSRPPWAGGPMKYRTKVNYSQDGFYFKGAGVPKDVLRKAAENLVKHYNKQIINRVRESFRRLDRKWVV